MPSGLNVVSCMLTRALYTQSVDYSAFIRQAFNGDKGLAGAITKLPLEKKFRLQTVKEVGVHTENGKPAACLAGRHCKQRTSPFCSHFNLC